jgi:hypothetical protein
MAQCGGHEDRTPSLSVHEGIDGRCFLHCFAGCDTEAVLDALDLDWIDLFPNVLGDGDRPPQPRVQAVGATEVEEIRRVLLEAAQDTRDASGPAREEVPGTNGLLHRGVAAVFFGERGGGKTTAAIVTTMSAAARGERVLYVDRENGAALTKDRVEGILAAHEDWGDLLDGRFVGRHYPELRPNWNGEAFAEALGGFTVVIFDSVREMLAQLRLDPDRETDISVFMNLAVTPLLRRGVAVVLLDNVGHQEKHRPKGSATKLDACQQGYKVISTAPFSPVQIGALELECYRSRFGDIDRKWTMRVGGGLFEVPETQSESPDVQRARHDREDQDCFERVAVGVLREISPVGRDRLLGEIRKAGFKGKQQALRERLGRAVAGRVGIVHGPDGYALEGGPEARVQGGSTPVRDYPWTPGPALKGPGSGSPGPVDAVHPRPADDVASNPNVRAWWRLQEMSGLGKGARKDVPRASAPLWEAQS